jgi:hypothetical protein
MEPHALLGRGQMSHYLSGLPIWLLTLLLVVIPTVIVMALQVFLHSRIGVQRLAKNNEIAGFKFATVGVIYAVLLAFSVIAVWEKFSVAEAAVDQEGAAMAALFRYAAGKEPEAVQLLNAISTYGRTAVDREWPAMARETESPETTDALSAVYAAALALNKIETRNSANMSEVFSQIDHITAARRLRLHLATGLVPSVIWVSLFASAFLTVGFTLFFGSENLAAQAAMTGILAALVLLGLVVILAIDHPFTGTVHIDPEPIEAVLIDFHAR